MNVRQVIPRDTIPSIDDPVFGSKYFGESDDEVIVVDSTPPRAYPIRILHYHEIVNDDLDQETSGEPIAVTWCPLCGSAIVYNRTVDGQTLTFGVSGKLADDDLVMYDRETESEWKQSLGACIAGNLEGKQLTIRPAAMKTWEAFREEYPDGVVLQSADTKSEAASDDDTPATVDYDLKPYERYFESDGFGLSAHRGGEGGRTWTRDDLEPKTIVLGIESDGEALGFPLPRVQEAGEVVQTMVGSTAVVVFATDGELHAFADSDYEFRPDRGGFVADGTRWDGSTGCAEDGRQLERLPARRLFAFVWQDDHGPEAFFEA